MWTVKKKRLNKTATYEQIHNIAKLVLKLFINTDFNYYYFCSHFFDKKNKNIVAMMIPEKSSLLGQLMEQMRSDRS